VTTTLTKPGAEGASAIRALGRRRLTLPWILLIAAGALALFSIVRLITDANDLTSVGQTSAALQLAVPIAMAGLGGLWAERAGVINIGLEGMMILGTWFGAWAGYQWGPWTGVAMGVLGGALGGLLHALLTVTFGVDHIVSGVAITILAGGVAKYLSGLTFGSAPGGSDTQSPPVESIGTVTVPGLSDWLRDLAGKHWFFISDLAGLLGGLVTRLSLLTVVCAAVIALTYYVLWKTPFGLRLRSTGENPVAAESLGVNVYKYKYIAVVVSGGMAGLGGAFLVTVASSFYREGQVGGRGYIGLAAMIFGNWRPGGLAAGSMLFGYTDALQLRQGGTSVHALLLLFVVLLAGMALWSLWKRRWIGAAASAVIAVAVLLWYLNSTTVPSQFVTFAPHLTTLLVLALASQRLRPPKADGMRYRRGQSS
jgi:simple sugar transport system permease protein